MLIGVWNVYGIFVFSVQSSYRPKAALRNGVGGGGGLVAKSCLTLVISRAVAHQAPLSMGFPRQEYWSRLPCPSPRDLHKWLLLTLHRGEQQPLKTTTSFPHIHP